MDYQRSNSPATFQVVFGTNGIRFLDKMVHAKVPIVCLLALLCAISAAHPVLNDSSEINYRLPKNTAPIHYDLKFVLDQANRSTFDGEIAVEFKVVEPTQDVALHLRNLTLNEAATRLTFKNGSTVAPEWHKHDNETEVLTIRFPNRLETGEHVLHLSYFGQLSDEWDGIFKSSYKDQQRDPTYMLLTQFEPISARRAFPCWDEPALKATFDVSIKHYANFTALSNMPVRNKSEVDETDGKMWTRFERTPIMSTYLVAFAVGDLVNVSNADGTIAVWSRREMRPKLDYGLEIARKASKELERYTNSTVRVPKMDHIALPEHRVMAMENWGLITYPEIEIVYKKGETSIARKYEITAIVIHELAHQWFGNAVSPTWWSHLWLNEGFASYFQYYIMDKVFNGSRAMDLFVVQVVQGSLSADTQWHLNPIDADIKTPSQIEEAFSSAVYNKAPAVLWMLSSIISPEIFQAGIVRYLDEHEFSSADSNCLWNALQSALDDFDVPRSDLDVKQVMDTWIKQKRYPLVYAIRDYSSGTMTLFQKDFGLIDVHQHSDEEEYRDENNPYEWWVPINYATAAQPDFSSARPTHWLKPKENLTIEGLHADDWVIVNKQHGGYYRVTYDEENYRKIAKHLRSENFTDIHVLNRAQIVSDVAELLLYDQVQPAIFLDVVTYLSHETDYIPWHSIFRFFGNIADILQFPTAQPIRDLISRSMENLINDVGFDEQVDEDAFKIFTRIKVLQWACKVGHEGCKQGAAVKLFEHLENPKANRISANQRSWVYGYGMKSANESVWNKWFEWCTKNPCHDELRALSDTENPALFRKYLNAIVSNDTALSAERKERMMISAINFQRSPYFFDVLLDFYDQRWDEIASRFEFAAAHLCELSREAFKEEQVEKARKVCLRINNEHCGQQSFFDEALHRLRRRQSLIERWNDLINKKNNVYSSHYRGRERRNFVKLKDRYKKPSFVTLLKEWLSVLKNNFL